VIDKFQVGLQEFTPPVANCVPELPHLCSEL